MNNETLMKIEARIDELIEGLDSVEIGSPKHTEVLDEINKLYGILNSERRLELDERKLDNDYSIRDRELDNEENKIYNDEQSNLREYELKVDDSKKNRKLDAIWNGLKVAVEIGSIGAPLICYMVYMDRGFKFEEKGTYTSKTFMNLLSRFKPN